MAGQLNLCGAFLIVLKFNVHLFEETTINTKERI